MKNNFYFKFILVSLTFLAPIFVVIANGQANSVSGEEISGTTNETCVGDATTGEVKRIGKFEAVQTKSLVEKSQEETLLCTKANCTGDVQSGGREVAQAENFKKVDEVAGRVETKDGKKVCGGPNKKKITEEVVKPTDFAKANDGNQDLSPEDDEKQLQAEAKAAAEAKAKAGPESNGSGVTTESDAPLTEKEKAEMAADEAEIQRNMKQNIEDFDRAMKIQKLIEQLCNGVCR